MGYHDCGEVAGPLLVFGGPYSNLQATRALRAAARRLGIPAGNCLCTGDVVAYCADAAATVAEIRDWGCRVIAGNCEKQIASGAEDCGCGFIDGSVCDLLSDAWYGHALGEILPDDRAWMAALPDHLRLRHDGRAVAVCHGGFSDISRFLWPNSSDAEFLAELTHLETPPDIVLSGHSGLVFDRRIGSTRWINAGSIGMPPNDGTRQTRFAILDASGLRFHRLDYDWRAAQQAMQANGLTQGYQTALETGFWPSEDVLPHSLRRSAEPARG